MTVITNGLTIALELEKAIPRFQVIVTGGTLRPLQHSLVEPLATTVLRELHADLAFIGCNGVHPANGITNINLPEADLKRVMVDAAERSIVVADGSKIGRTHLGQGRLDRRGRRADHRRIGRCRNARRAARGRTGRESG